MNKMAAFVERHTIETLTTILIAASWSTVLARDVPVPAEKSFASTWDRVHFSHALWDESLEAHVDEHGLVDYVSIGSDPRFLEYLYRLAHTDARGLESSDARLAYWLNAYNAFAIRGVGVTLPVDEKKWSAYSVLDVSIEGSAEPGKGFFRGLRFMAGGRRVSLDEIEKAILLRNPSSIGSRPAKYKGLSPNTPDARVHMAIVCASRGCPPLSKHAFEASTIDAQLGARARSFLQDTTRCRIDTRRLRIEISELFHWYAKDFSNPAYKPRTHSVPEFLAKYVDDERLARSLRSDRWQITYLPYDWKLNLGRAH